VRLATCWDFGQARPGPYARDYFGRHSRTVVFCAGSSRSVLAVEALLEVGFTNIAHLATGFSGGAGAGEHIDDVSETSRWSPRAEFRVSILCPSIDQAVSAMA